MVRCSDLASRPRLILLLSLVIWSLTAAATVAATNSPLPNRRLAISHINELMGQDRRSEALLLCRQYADNFPDDADMLYNLACLENTVGDETRAEEAYAAALAAGFNEFILAADDPDLQGDLHDVIVTMNTAEQERLAVLAKRQSLTLDRDIWSAPRDLIPHGPVETADITPVSSPRLRLRWHETGLEMEITTDKDWSRALAASTLAPWNGGPGLLLSLSVPDGTADWESANHFLFAFGTETNGGVGSMFVTSMGHWQPVAELMPKIKAFGVEQVRLTATIPWQALMPYDPMVDNPLGINATLVIPRGPFRRRASLVETTDTVNPLARRRRFARLDFRTDSINTDQFAGKLSDSVSRKQPLAVDLVAVSTMAGDATLSLNFMDQAGRSVLPDGPLKGKFTLKQGTNHLTRQADFRALKAGGYVLQAELIFPSGRSQTWGAAVLNLPDGWQDQFKKRMTMVASSEQPTVHYLLDSITTAVANHRVRRNPGAIVTTLMNLDQMLANAEESGTIMPDKGNLLLVYPGPDGRNRLCRVYLPAGREHSDGLNPILLLEHGGGQEAKIAARIGRNYEFGTQKPTLKTGRDDRFPVYLVPELLPDLTNLSADLVAEAEACRRWAQNYFHAPAVSLAGIDAAGGIALRMVKRAPDTVRGLLVFAGSGLDPWPQARPDFIRRQLGPPPTDLPITWIDFQMETDGGGQARDILVALKDLGYDIADEQEVRGSLSLTQVADRVVLWAEGLR